MTGNNPAASQVIQEMSQSFFFQHSHSQILFSEPLRFYLSSSINLPMPSLLRKSSNAGRANGLVKPSATIFFVGTYSTLTWLVWIASRMK
jgi:hypothetical protein